MSSQSLPPTRRALFLLNEPNRHRAAVKFSVTGLDSGDDDEDGVQDPEDGEENEAGPGSGKTWMSMEIWKLIAPSPYASIPVDPKVIDCIK